MEYEFWKSVSSDFIWKGTPHDQGILAHQLVNSKYNPPSEIHYQPEEFPFWENPTMNCDLAFIYSNPDQCLRFYYDTVLKPEYDSHNHSSVLAVFGGDFHWYDSNYNFGYLQHFIELLNTWGQELFGIKINAAFATVNDYFDSLKVPGLEFHTYTGDFIPYIETGDGKAGLFDYWTGFYSSSPTLKLYIKQTFLRLRSLEFELLTAYVRELELEQNYF